MQHTCMQNTHNSNDSQSRIERAEAPSALTGPKNEEKRAGNEGYKE
jgi:hypothetical protein